MRDWRAFVEERLNDLRALRGPEVVEELTQQLEQAYADALANGRTAAEAEAYTAAQLPNSEALRRVLAPAATPEAAEGSDRAGWLGDLGRDIRYALRGLRRSPGFTATALVILALAIGANTAIFSLIDAVMLRLLPVPQARQLVLLTDPDFQGSWSGTTSGRRAALSYEEYIALRDHIPPFSGLLAAEATVNEVMVSWDAVAGSDAAGAETVKTKLVSSNYFEVLGLHPERGRLFIRATDDGRDPAPVAVLSDRYWRRRFARDPNVIGRTFRAPAGVFTVIGIAPAGFDGEMVGIAADLYAPLGCDPLLHPGQDRLHDSQTVPTRGMWLDAIGRLRPGATLAQASTAAAVAFHPLAAAQSAVASKPEYRAGLLRQHLDLTMAGHGASQLRAQYKAPLFALFGLVAMVLLIAIVNLASLLLARAAVREKEIGVRLVLGARRSRLLRQLLAESLVLALLGGICGLALAELGNRLLLRLVAGSQPDIPLDLGLDWRVLAFAAALCVFTGLAFGLAPALRLARLRLHAPVQAQSARRLPILKLLTVAQVAISLVALVGAGLFFRTLNNLKTVPLGFQSDHLGEFELDAAAAGYHDAAASLLYQKALRRIQATPGVVRAAISEDGLFEGDDSGDDIEVAGALRMALGAQPGSVQRMVLGEILLLVAGALAVGIPASLAAARLIATQLFGLRPYDAATLGVAAFLLATVALLAGFLPARRASRMDPLAALRCD